MSQKYFGQINLVIESGSEDEAENIQQSIRELVEQQDGIADASADERVELDEFGHAG